MPRIVGADTAYPVTDALIAKATTVMGTVPSFWGRYLSSRREKGTVEYRRALENAVLAFAVLAADVKRGRRAPKTLMQVQLIARAA